jgi:hypothetical protein
MAMVKLVKLSKLGTAGRCQEVDEVRSGMETRGEVGKRMPIAQFEKMPSHERII